MLMSNEYDGSFDNVDANDAQPSVSSSLFFCQFIVKKCIQRQKAIFVQFREISMVPTCESPVKSMSHRFEMTPQIRIRPHIYNSLWYHILLFAPNKPFECELRKEKNRGPYHNLRVIVG